MKKKLEKEVEVLVRKWKKTLATQVREEMKRRKVSPSKLAAQVKTSRAVVYRFLNPKETGVTFETLAKVSRALGLELRMTFKEKG